MYCCNTQPCPISYVFSQYLPDFSAFTMQSDNVLLVTQCLFLFIIRTECQIIASPSVQEVVELSNSLVPKLLQHFYESEKDFAVSSFGLATNLAMIMEGIDEMSRQEITGGLNLQLTRRNSWQSIRNGFGLLLKDFEDQKFNSDVAGTYNNAIIYSSLPLKPEYQNILLKYYRANVTQLEPQSNVTEHTMEISSDSGVISHWKDYKSLAVYTYLEHQSEGTFNLPEEGSVSVPMIPILSPSAGYISALNCLAAQLPLEDFSSDLYVIMPESKDAMKEVLKKMTNKKLSSLLLSLPQKDYEVTIPQLSIISKDLNLKPFLKSIGIKRVFKRNNSGKARVVVSKISQNSYFGTSFIGLKTVASSNAVMKKQASRSRQRREESTKLEFNKPFIFCVVHRLSGLILLNGVVTHPKQNP